LSASPLMLPDRTEKLFAGTVRVSAVIGVD